MIAATIAALGTKPVVNLEGIPHDCGGTFRLIRAIRPVVIGPARIDVEQEFFRCDGCDEERQTLTQMGNARRTAAAEVRTREKLLSPEDIRRIREDRLELTQAGLENALGLGAKTVVRWETGKVLQPKATDNLLRLLDKDPCLVCFLAELNGAEAPAHLVAADHSDSHQALPIPRSYMTELEAVAKSEGVDVPTFLTWMLAEKLTTAKVGIRRVESQVEAMHSDLAKRMASLEQAWQPKGFLFPKDRRALTQRNLTLPNREPYAQSA